MHPCSFCKTALRRLAPSLLLLLTVFLFTGCGIQKGEAESLLLGSTVQPMSENLKEETEGNYEPVTALYPEGQQYDPGFAGFLIRDGALYGFQYVEGEWQMLGELQRVSLSAEKIESVCRNVAVSEGYLPNIPELFRRSEYRAASGETEYYLSLPYTEHERYMACVQNGDLIWLKQIWRVEELREADTYAYVTESEALPHTLDLRTYDRTYLLEIPSSNFAAEGTFRYEEDGTVLILIGNNGGEALFSVMEYGFRLTETEGDWPGLTEGESFRLSSWKYLRDLYGSASIDLDGDGFPETVRLGDHGFSGPLGLDISVDSIGQDALRWYYAEHGEVSLIEEKGRLYGQIHYTPWKKPESDGRFEIHYDGENLWITDEEGKVIEDNIDLQKNSP